MDKLTIAHTTLYSIGVVLILLGLLRFIKYRNLEIWVEVPATINNIRESSYSPFLSIFSPSSLWKVYYPEINYAYFYKGENFESDKVSLDLSNIGILLADKDVIESYNNRFWYKWKRGFEIKAYVNPDNPRKSVLINKMSHDFKSINIMLVVSGILIIAFSLFGLPYIISNSI